MLIIDVYFSLPQPPSQKPIKIYFFKMGEHSPKSQISARCVGKRPISVPIGPRPGMRASLIPSMHSFGAASGAEPKVLLKTDNMGPKSIAKECWTRSPAQNGFCI